MLTVKVHVIFFFPDNLSKHFPSHLLLKLILFILLFCAIHSLSASLRDIKVQAAKWSARKCFTACDSARGSPHGGSKRARLSNRVQRSLNVSPLLRKMRLPAAQCAAGTRASLLVCSLRAQGSTAAMVGCACNVNASKKQLLGLQFI